MARIVLIKSLNQRPVKLGSIGGFKMARPAKENTATNETEACEIIELTINDLDSLTRAFEMLADICVATSPAHDEEQHPKVMLH